jgi:hypothetical protein
MPLRASPGIKVAIVAIVTALTLSLFWVLSRTPASAEGDNFWLSTDSHTVFTIAQPYWETPQLGAYEYYSGYAGPYDTLYVSVRTTSIDGCGLGQLIVDGVSYPGSSSIQLDGGQVHNIFADYNC